MDKAVETGLTEMGHSIEMLPDLQGEALTNALGQSRPDVLVVRSTKVGADAMDKAEGLRLIVRAGAGVDNIDLEAARARQVKVANCAGANAAAVAELTFGLLIAADRQIPQQSQALKEGLWRKGHFGDLNAPAAPAGLRSRTLGLVGFGMVAREVAALGKAFGMQVVAWNRGGVPADAGVEECLTLPELAGMSDAVCVLAASPTPLVDALFLSRLPPNALLVNVARGSAVDDTALLHAVETRGLKVGLDVFSDEPAAPHASFTSASGLVGHPSVVCTHHIGAATRQAQEAVGLSLLQVVRSFEATGVPDNLVP